jgi:hypothetical protein
MALHHHHRDGVIGPQAFYKHVVRALNVFPIAPSLTMYVLLTPRVSFACRLSISVLSGGSSRGGVVEKERNKGHQWPPGR